MHLHISFNKEKKGGRERRWAEKRGDTRTPHLLSLKQQITGRRNCWTLYWGPSGKDGHQGFPFSHMQALWGLVKCFLIPDYKVLLLNISTTAFSFNYKVSGMQEAPIFTHNTEDHPPVSNYSTSACML